VVTTAPPTASPTAPRATTPPPASGSALRYHFPADGCSVSYGAYHHDYPATDIFAPRGCHFVAVVNGRVDEVSYHDTWHSSTNLGAARGGLSVSIVGDDGVRYYGSHLERIAAGIAPGVRVRAGEVLGYVGNTGDARGIATHIHFGVSWPTAAGMWWVRRGELSPYDYLRAWQAGRTTVSPHAAVERLRRSLGGDPHCRVDC
jgi:murein DD-endopeptidase MepM/ murein hydrolase activator NlpD